MTLDEAFAAVSHAFPTKAEWQGMHFQSAHKNGVTLIESRKSSFETISTCPHCGQPRQQRDSKFFYWLIWEGNQKLIDASVKSKLQSMKTIGESLALSRHTTTAPDSRRPDMTLEQGKWSIVHQDGSSGSPPPVATSHL